MPIEIKELHIRVAVNAPSGHSSSDQIGAMKLNDSAGESTTDKEAIIAECLEQVLKILQNKMER